MLGFWSPAGASSRRRWYGAGAGWLLCLISASASASSVLDVNQSLLDAVRLRSASPPVASRDMALVGIAMYDAVNAATGLRDRPYAYTGGAVGGASADAAAYSAGYTMLSNLFPALAAGFADTLATRLTGLGGGIEVNLGATLGASVSTAFAAGRATDGSAAAQSAYVYGSGPGAYVSTSAATQPLLPGWGLVSRFAVGDLAAVLPGSPPAVGSAAWLASFIDARDRGCAGCGSAQDQVVARFWSDIGGTETPPGHWLAIADTVIAARDMDVLDEARVSAMLGAAEADAAIAAWATKYRDNNWRPVTAIRTCTVAVCGAAGDPAWTPLWAAPNFPGYISGHSTFSAAAATTLAGIFGDATEFCSASDPAAGFRDGNGDAAIVQRCYASFSEAADEAGESRILGGIHFGFDDVAGLETGRAVGQAVLAGQFAVAEPPTLPLLAAAMLAPAIRLRRRRGR